MPRGKNINLFLMDGDASGRIKCTLANWTGVAYKIPRTEIEKCKIIDNILQEDVLFTSPSSAAEFVTGKSCNGWVSWKTKDGKTLHDLEESY